MSEYRVEVAAAHRLDEIYDYTSKTWGEDQADRYLRGLSAQFAAIANRQIPWRAIPAEFEIEGFVCRYEKHLIYWRLLGNGSVGIVTVLHERMHQIDRVRDDFA